MEFEIPEGCGEPLEGEYQVDEEGYERPRFSKDENVIVNIDGVGRQDKFVSPLWHVMSHRIIQYHLRVKMGPRRWVNKTILPKQVSAMYMMDRIKGQEAIRDSQKTYGSVGPEFPEEDVSKASCMESWGSKFKNPGPDFTLWTLFDAEGNLVSQKRLEGY